jgi:hypothetical protein
LKGELVGDFSERVGREAQDVPWLSIALGVLATIIGIILTAANADPGTGTNVDDNTGLYLILGGILTAFGPVAISHAISKNLGRQEAREQMQDHIRSISMNLGQSLSSLTHALSQQSIGAEDSRTTLRLVAGVVPTVEVQIGELQKLVGAPFSADDLLVTKEQLQPLVDDLQRKWNEGDPGAVKDAADKLARTLRKSTQQLALTVRENLPCPACNVAVVCDIGVQQGSTARVTCGSCDVAFNAHRGPNGPFAKSIPVQPVVQIPVIAPPAVPTIAPPAPAASKALEVACPSCTTRYEVRAGTRWPKAVICFRCDLALSVDEYATVMSSHELTRVPAAILRSEGKSFYVACPRCSSERRCWYRQDGTIHGYCFNDSWCSPSQQRKVNVGRPPRRACPGRAVHQLIAGSR